MLILASASPRRRELLAQAQIACTVEPSSIDESLLPGEAAAGYVQRLAVEKALAVCRSLQVRGPLDPGTLVLGADTAVVLPDGTILGKPTGPADARRMLTELSGRTHSVMTGVAVVSASQTLSDVEITHVTFNIILPSEIETYLRTGEPFDKAGAYAIQGYAARWIPRIEGDYTNVVGLPIARVVSLLAEAGQADTPGSLTKD